ncbi:carbon starvation protein A [bacterium]|nr:carbon starvation protein A [bacterium]
MIAVVVLVSMVILALGYVFYGKWLSRRLDLDDARPTPACAVDDGMDYVPAGKGFLLGQHFSAIAAAGPIVGPILAGIWFGWLPTLLWILLGAIFIGGVHDFSSLLASVRHKAASIGELARQNLSRRVQILFLVFVWLALVYVIIAFADVTAQSFKTVAAGTAFGPAVVSSSLLYLLLGLALGLLLFKAKWKLSKATLLFIPVLFLIIWAGGKLPESLAGILMGIPVRTYEIVLLVYCFVAAVIPVWLLLQPRGYLGGWFLYLTMAAALLGSLFGGFRIEYPALNLDGFASLYNGRLIFPVLFITVACGACSGFHGIVSSGTTSKQISKESDTLVVGYGSMILEGLVAVLALATVMMLPAGHEALKGDPNFIYARGLAGYLERIGVPHGFGLSFALLAFSTFVYDTLDVATRLGRYIIQELFGWRSRKGAAAAILVTLLLPLLFFLFTQEKAYLVAWPIFGTSNQLLASLTLLVISVWLSRSGKKAVFTLLPMAFMMVFTLWSLVLQIRPFLLSFLREGAGVPTSTDLYVTGISGIVLLALALWLMIEAFFVIRNIHGKELS